MRMNNLVAPSFFRVMVLALIAFGALAGAASYLPGRWTVAQACHVAGKSTLAGDGTQVCDCTVQDDTCTCILPPKFCPPGSED
jgi:hypothetical protein